MNDCIRIIRRCTALAAAIWRGLAAVLLLLSLSAHVAAAGKSPACCACLQAGTMDQALFCSLRSPEFDAKCAAQQGTVECLALSEPPTQSECRALLDDKSFNCPAAAAAAAPALGSGGLAGTVVLLVGVGIWAARRRPDSRPIA